MEYSSYIYVLIDPRDRVIRYVGQTQKEPLKRLLMHWLQPSNKQMAAWFAELNSCDLRPTLRILERVRPEDRRRREDYWMVALITNKVPLLNSSLPVDRAYLESIDPWPLPGDILEYTPDPE